MFKVRPATADDVAPAIAALVEAFAPDPLMTYLYGDHPAGVRASVATFFTILLRVRLTLGMPAFVLEQDGQVLGAVMGYDTTRPTWPADLAEEWRRFETSAPDLIARFAAYEHITDACQPSQPHHYLGVIGVHPTLQGQGAGKLLLEVFCDHARADPLSNGVYLDTTNPNSLAFYDTNGFARHGEGDLGGTPVWCVWRET